jgi:hypothetical protein
LYPFLLSHAEVFINFSVYFADILNILSYYLHTTFSLSERCSYIFLYIYLAEILNILFYHSYYLKGVNTFTVHVYFTEILKIFCPTLSTYYIHSHYLRGVYTLPCIFSRNFEYFLHSHYLRGVYTFPCIFSRNIEYLLHSHYLRGVYTFPCIFSRNIEYSVLLSLLLHSPYPPPFQASIELGGFCFFPGPGV